ncbi:MAG TPA: cell division protein FtsZ [Solirubrobacteraceae bacterium]|jgi:cell division protein FtsZ|nr:cell division protein FtsZ [Solirubrobacteraceae bacterium]
MANPKRASMREGPLAALFRKTEELDKDSDSPAQQAPPDAATPAGSVEASAESGSPSFAQSDQGQPPAAGRTAVDSVHAQVEHPRDSGVPHPSLAPGLEEEQEGTRVPSPQERLRHAFSSEIPENLMDRPRPGASTPAPTHVPARDTYAREEYAREEARPFGEAMPVAQPVIRVVGVGGAGTNAVNRMVEAEVEGVEFLAINTDLQSLQQSTADITLHIGAELTRGLGSGSDANVGRQAAMDDYDRVKALLKGSDMIFITAGAGGGTGTGAAPIVARIAREVGALTVAIVTKPFGFEGSRRAEQAERGVESLAEEVDTLIVVPNNRLLTVLDKATAMVEAFRVADDVLRQGVQGISDLVTLPGLINLDFADVRTIMSDAGNALLGIGMGFGENRAPEAAAQAVASPLLETSMEGARSILLSITGGRDLSLWEVNEAAKAVSEAAHPDANIIFGAMVDEKLDDQVWVTVVATGYGVKGTRPQMREPDGEPRVKRTGPSARDTRQSRRGGLAVSDMDVPEFIPNF